MVYIGRALSIIKEMYLHGGIGICTQYDSIPGVGSSFSAQTFIQPDGDIINKIPEYFLANPEDLNEHFEKVKQNITVLRRFRMSLRALLIISPFPAVYPIWTLITQEEANLMVWIPPIGISIVSCLIGLFGRYSLRRYVMRKLDKLV